MELKPCPFCGGIPTIEPAVYGMAARLHHECVFVFDVIFKDRATAIEAWNTRAERTCELNGTISWEWHTTSTTFYTHSLSCGHNVTTTEQEPPCYCEECGAKVVGA